MRVDSTAGQLYPLSSSGNNHYRVAKNDWSNFNEANDHAYKAAAPMSANERIRVYYKGQLVYGTEPASGARLAAVSLETGLTAVAYPNPTTDRVTVEVPGAGEQKVSFQLTNPTGRVIFEQQVNPDQHWHRLVLPLTGYPTGLYLLRVNTLREMTTLKIIRQ